MTSMFTRVGWANDGQVHLSVQKGGIVLVQWQMTPASYSANFQNLATTTSSQMSGAQHSNTVSYHSWHGISAVGSGRWMAEGGSYVAVKQLSFSFLRSPAVHLSFRVLSRVVPKIFCRESTSTTEPRLRLQNPS